MVTARLAQQPSTSASTLAISDWNNPPSVVKTNNLPPLAYDSEVKKTDLNDKFDAKKLISKVPKQWREKAKHLLEEIDNRSAELTFDCQGNIFIDGESIPHSNILRYFPLLYKKRTPKDLPGFEDFVQKLKTMGLESLFILQMHKKSKIKLDSIISNSMSEKNWWVLN